MQDPARSDHENGTGRLPDEKNAELAANRASGADVRHLRWNTVVALWPVPGTGVISVSIAFEIS